MVDSSGLNMNVHLLISPAKKRFSFQNIIYKPAINMLKKTNINYVFNAISLANVFATDLSMMQFNKQK